MSPMKSVVVLLSLLLQVATLAEPDQPPDDICCVYDQWTAVFYLDNVNVFMDDSPSPFHSLLHPLPHPDPRGPQTAASYLNATVLAAYDWSHSRTYLKVEGSQVSNVVPTPIDASTTIINDYASGVQYQFHGNECQKSKLDNMTRQCVPNSSFPGGSALIGVDVTTQQLVFLYSFNQSPFRLSIRISNYCDPVSVMYSPPSPSNQSLVLYSLEVMDLVYGINDTSIFTPPPSCRSADWSPPRDPFVLFGPF